MNEFKGLNHISAELQRRTYHAHSHLTALSEDGIAASTLTLLLPQGI